PGGPVIFSLIAVPQRVALWAGRLVRLRHRNCTKVQPCAISAPSQEVAAGARTRRVHEASRGRRRLCHRVPSHRRSAGPRRLARRRRPAGASPPRWRPAHRVGGLALPPQPADALALLPAPAVIPLRCSARSFFPVTWRWLWVLFRPRG